MADNTWFPLSKGHPQARALNPDNETPIAEFLQDNYIGTGIGATKTQLKHLCLDSYAAQSDDERHLERFSASTVFKLVKDYHCEPRTKNGGPNWMRVMPLTSSRGYIASQTIIHRIKSLIWTKRADTFLRRLKSGRTEGSIDDQAAGTDERKDLFYRSRRDLRLRAEATPLDPDQRKNSSIQAQIWRPSGCHPETYRQRMGDGKPVSNYIERLHCDIAQRYLALILDVSPTHRTDLVFQTATANDVELLFVPTGATGIFQPMDRRIFGELKGCARGEFGRRRWLNGRTDIGYDESVAVLARCWDAIPGKNVRKVWNIASAIR
jgi:hypothetical protein